MLKQYKHLFALDGVELIFEDDALHAVAELAETRKTGARGLRSMMEGILQPIMFEVPDRQDVTSVNITHLLHLANPARGNPTPRAGRVEPKINGCCHEGISFHHCISSNLIETSNIPPGSHLHE